MNVAGSGGKKILRHEIKMKQLSTTIPVHGVKKSSAAMGIRNENSVATIAISNLDFGVKKMEFKKLPIDDLIPASYNPRKKLKPGYE